MFRLQAYETITESSVLVFEIGFIINKKLVDTTSSFITVLSQVHHKLQASACVCLCVYVLCF